MRLMPTLRPCAFFRFRTRQRHNAGYLTPENRIFYPFHPRCGETVAIVRTHRFQGADVFVVQQPDGTLAHIPRWMMEETAARYSLGSQPRLPLDHLRNLRLEIDGALLERIDMRNLFSAYRDRAKPPRLPLRGRSLLAD